MGRARWIDTLSPLVLVGMVLALSRAAGAVGVLPVLGLFRGPLGLLLLVGAAGLALVRAYGPRGRAESHSERASLRASTGDSSILNRHRPLILFALGAAVSIAAGLADTSRLRVSGDEPHYLIMAQSLWRDGDLDLENNFAHEDYLEYTPGPVRPHYGAPRRDGRPYPAHSPGLPVLLAPVYALAGRAGCVVLLALCGAVVAARTSTLARRMGADDGAALWAWAAAVGPPVAYYSFHMYTEAPSALAVVLALELLLGPPTVAGALAAALVTSLLPWFHVKMLLAAVALGVVGLGRLRGRPLAAFVATSAAMALAYGLYYQSLFGRPTPLAIYGGIPADISGSPWRALVGLLLDRSFGLLPHAPLFLLALPGLAWIARRWRASWPLLLVLAVTLAPVLLWRMWWGGQCPPARFLVPMLPFLVVALALRLARSSTGLARWWRGLLLTGAVLSAVAVAEPAARLLLNRGNRPTRLWAALSDGAPIGDYLPTLTHASERDARVALVWIVAFGVLLVLDRLADRDPRVDRAFSSFAAAVAAVLLLGIVIDLGVGPPTPAPLPAPVALDEAG